MMRGLFGSRRMGRVPNPYTMPLPDMQNVPTTAGGQFGNPMVHAEGRKPGLGTRLLGEGWEGKAAALGSALMGNPFAIQQYQGQQDNLRAHAEQLAAAQRQQSQMMAAAQDAGISPNQAALLGPEGLRQVMVGRMQPEEGPKPGSFEWFQTATPEQRALYDQYNPVIATTWQGPTPVPRSSLGGAPTAPVGKLTPITTSNTPAPQVGANGMPTQLTRAQYQAVVNSMGQAETEAWARRNNIRVVE